MTLFWPIAAAWAELTALQPLCFAVPLQPSLDAVLSYSPSLTNCSNLLLCIYSLPFPAPKFQEIENSNNQRHEVDFNNFFLWVNDPGVGTRIESPISRNLLYWGPSTCLQNLTELFLYLPHVENKHMYVCNAKFMCYCGKMPNQSNVKEEGFMGAQLEGPLHHGGEGMVAKCKAAGVWSLCLNWKVTIFSETKPQVMQVGHTLCTRDDDFQLGILCHPAWCMWCSGSLCWGWIQGSQHSKQAFYQQLHPLFSF